MQIHVARNGQQLGQYSVEEINRQLADGTLLPTDLAWHQGAAGWASLSSIAGVTLPSGPASPPAPLATPPVPAAPPPRPVYSAPINAAPGSCKGMVLTSWILLGLTFVISLIPVLCCGSWFLVWPVALATFVMAIVILNRGEKTQGVLLILASIAIVPLALVVPVITTAALGGVVSQEEHKQEAQIMENLRMLVKAKERWVAQTKVPDGSNVTVAGLAAYMDGKQIKPVVGEVYDPRPVGQRPTATLPATKSLADHGKGGVLIADDAPAAAADASFSPAETPERL
jgi:hypothetical protein